jgi:2-desacetyl-2-hydroxyethyl bacteriochlorophyllide A dehydrogenase
MAPSSVPSCPAIVFEGRGSVSLRTVRLPMPDAIDAVVRTRLSGISAGTERWTLTGRYGGIDATYPFIPGYQRIGVVEWTGVDVRDVHVGDLVFVNVTKLEEPDLRDKHWTGHIGYSVAPSAELIPIPAGLAPEEAAISPLAAVAWNGVKMAAVEAGDLVVVLGLGVIGQMAGQLARLRGATVIGTDPIDQRRELAAQYAADEVVHPDPLRLREAVRRREPAGADVVIDTTGRSEDFALMVELVKERGRICLQGYYPDALRIDPHPTHLKQPTVLFTCYWVDHRTVMDWLARGQLTMRPYIGGTFDYRDAPKVYRRLIDDPSGLMTGLFDWHAQPTLALPPVHADGSPNLD